MVSVLSKPSDRIDLEDICSLISEQVPEGIQIEYKECLPSRDGRSDPWSRGENTIGDYAKQEILDEVVAFANAYGGALVLGLVEDGTHPPVAARLSPVPDCAELAARFRHVFRDRVEPPLPVLDVLPVQTEGEQGIVVFRTARSRRGPHRVNHARNLWKCPVRRSDRCEAMGMREIHDMTLNLARGAERLERRLHDRSRKFQSEFKKLQSPEDAFGIRVTAIPVDDDVRFDSVLSAGQLVDALRPPEVGMTRITERDSVRLRTLRSQYRLQPEIWRPILRGARAEAERILFDHRQRFVYIEIHCDGVIEYGLVGNRLVLNEYKDRSKDVLDNEIPVTMLNSILVWAGIIREHAYAPGSEYAIQIEIRLTAMQMTVGAYNDMPVGEFGYSQKIEDGFPLYTFDEPGGIENIVALFERDFWNLLGKEIGEKQGTLKIDRT